MRLSTKLRRLEAETETALAPETTGCKGSEEKDNRQVEPLRVKVYNR